MTVQERIKADLKEAIKSGNTEKKNLLRVIIGEFNRIGKELTDEIATKEIKKMYVNATDKDYGNVDEAQILSEYLPKELSENDLSFIIKEIIQQDGLSSMKDMGVVMSKLKETYPNQYDGKLASTIVRKELA